MDERKTNYMGECPHCGGAIEKDVRADWWNNDCYTWSDDFTCPACGKTIAVQVDTEPVFILHPRKEERYEEDNSQRSREIIYKEWEIKNRVLIRFNPLSWTIGILVGDGLCVIWLNLPCIEICFNCRKDESIYGE